MMSVQRIVIASALILSGCNKSATEPSRLPKAATVSVPEATPAPAAVSQLVQEVAEAMWRQETDRAREHDSQTSTDPSDWMTVFSARTNRLHSLPLVRDRDNLVRVSLITDLEFFNAEMPSDLGILDGVEFMRSYEAALQVVEQQLRDLKDEKNAELVKAHRAAISK